MTLVYGTRAAVNESDLVNEMKDILNNALQLTSGPLGLPLYAGCPMDLLKPNYLVQQGYAEKYKL